jgi:hypothetical protein
MKIVFLMLMSVMILAANGQSVNNKPVNVNVPASALVFDQNEFGDRFSVLFYSEGEYDYYAVDLTKFRDRFERVYFVGLSYDDLKVVNVDSDIEKDQICFKTFYQNKEAEITCIFKDLKDKTAQAGQTMTADEKSAWLAKNDKFKKNESHE